MTVSLVVGASGTVGSGVVRSLTARGVSVRALTGKRERIGRDGAVEWAHADLVTGEGVAAAFAGVRRAFIFAPPGHADQYAILRPLIDEAQRRGLEKVVLMTAMGANAVEAAPLRQAELALERSGLAFNIVRPNWFMQNFNNSWVQGINQHGKILLPAGTAKVSFIDTRDISEAVARLLASDDLNGRDFDLTGPRALDHDEAAAILSKATGCAIAYQSIEPAAMRQGLLAAGLNEAYADFLVMILGFLAQGYNERVTGEVRHLIGRDPGSFERYAADHRQAWQVPKAA